MHQGTEKQFSYSYLEGMSLLQTLTMPSNMTLTQSYEEKRDLLIGMACKRGDIGVSERVYTYDSLGRPLTRRTVRNGSTVNDSFVHNLRSELASAQLNGTLYGYDYDKAPDGCKGAWINRAAGLPRRGEGAMGRARINIGNRKKGSADKEINHKKQIAQKSNALSNCMKMKFRCKKR